MADHDRHGRRNNGVRIPVNRPAKEVEKRPAEVEKGEADNSDEVHSENNDWQDRYLRLAADVDNTKKRLERNYAARAARKQEELIRDLLPLADNLERALAHSAPGERQTALYSGVELTIRDFLAALARHGVERIDALGEPFDPERHEALGAASHPSLEPGTVMHVELPGYTIDNRLIRPARVLVVAG